MSPKTSYEKEYPRFEPLLFSFRSVVMLRIISCIVVISIGVGLTGCSERQGKKYHCPACGAKVHADEDACVRCGLELVPVDN
jgi:hypothetical protein